LAIEKSTKYMDHEIIDTENFLDLALRHFLEMKIDTKTYMPIAEP
jgi:hypothetical protein